MVGLHDAQLRYIAKLVKKNSIEMSQICCAGAAGGLGFGVMVL